jgi:hypothetical protein
MKCKEKVVYHDAALAEVARVDLIRRNPKDPRNKTLVCYTCRDCGKWHVGHLRNMAQPVAPKPKKVKGPTPGQQRRAERKAAEKAAKQKLFADYTENLQIAKILIDRELARYAALGIKPRAPQQP